MKKRNSISVVLFVALTLLARAQNDSPQQPTSGSPPAGNDSQNRPEPAPAVGPVSVSERLDENPPISGLDQPSLEPRVAVRSFLLPGIVASESVDSNLGGTFGGGAIRGVTRGLGTLTLERLSSNYVTAFDYVGGGAVFTGGGRRAALIQELGAYQKIGWRTGQFSIRDSFSYLPEGSFGYGAYGGAGSYQSGLPSTSVGGGLAGGGIGGGGFFGGGQFGSLGQEPRISNVVQAEVVEALGPRSSVTAAGAYSITHFINSSVQDLNGLPNQLINSRQISGEVGYNYQLRRHDQVGIAYGIQDFHFPLPIEGSLRTHIWHVLYGHRISGKMDLTLGVGPQLIIINSPLFGDTRRLTVSGQASLRYRLRRSSLTLSYSRLTTNGSGFFLGATSDIARVSLARPLTRHWSAVFDLGYARNHQIIPGGGVTTARTYSYVYAGGAAHRNLGRNFSVFVSYQFNDLQFDSSFCAANTRCNTAARRQVATAGVAWHPRPIRLD